MPSGVACAVFGTKLLEGQVQGNKSGQKTENASAFGRGCQGRFRQVQSRQQIERVRPI